ARFVGRTQGAGGIVGCSRRRFFFVCCTYDRQSVNCVRELCFLITQRGASKMSRSPHASSKALQDAVAGQTRETVLKAREDILSLIDRIHDQKTLALANKALKECDDVLSEDGGVPRKIDLAA